MNKKVEYLACKSISDFIRKITRDYLQENTKGFLTDIGEHARKTVRDYDLPLSGMLGEVIRENEPLSYVRYFFDSLKSSEEFQIYTIYSLLGLGKEELTREIKSTLSRAAKKYFGRPARYNTNIVYKADSEQIEEDRIGLVKSVESVREEVETQLKELDNLLTVLTMRL